MAPDPTDLPAAPASRDDRDAADGGSALGAVARRADRTVLSTRGRCLLAAGIATAACAIPLEERDLLRVGAFAAVLPLLALLLALATRRTVRVQRTLSPHRLPVGAPATVTLQVTGGAAVGPLELVDTAPDAVGATSPPRFLVPSRRGAWTRPCTTPCARSGGACTGSARSSRTARTRSAWPSSPARSRAPSGCWCCPRPCRCTGSRTRSARATGPTARARRAPVRAARTCSSGPTAAATSCGACTGAARPATTS